MRWGVHVEEVILYAIKMKNLIALIFLTSSFAKAQFSRGAQFSFVNIEGQLTIQCPSRVSNTLCHESFMEPWPYDVFSGPVNAEASSLELRATVNGGADVRKTEVSYAGRTGRSSEINLGISSLFQRPLLRVGVNKIQYFITDRRKNVLHKGDFSVEVSRGSTRTCEGLRVVVGTDNDCDYSYSICQQYFTEMNYCR